MVWRLDRPDKPERRLPGNLEEINALAYNREGQIAAAGADRTIRIWTPQKKTAVVLRGHGEDVTTVVFTRGGQRVVSASQDGTVRLWDARGGEPLATLDAGKDAVYDLALSRDGQIATLGKDDVVRVFPCDVCGSLDQVRALAHSHALLRRTSVEAHQGSAPER